MDEVDFSSGENSRKLNFQRVLRLNVSEEHDRVWPVLDNCVNDVIELRVVVTTEENLRHDLV